MIVDRVNSYDPKSRLRITKILNWLDSKELLSNYGKEYILNNEIYLFLDTDMLNEKGNFLITNYYDEWLEKFNDTDYGKPSIDFWEKKYSSLEE